MERETVHLGPVALEVVQGDITRQPDVDAIVNAANARLMPGGGVAVLTSGHDLPNPWVIHCLGPVYGRDEPAAELLAACFRSALRLAEEKGMEGVAFPAISTGVFGYPAREAADVSVQAVREAAPGLGHVRRVRFVLFDENLLRLFERALG